MKNKQKIKCPNCGITMWIVRETEDVVLFECPNCGRKKKKIKKKEVYVQH